jgi:hypothetical protein
MLKLQSDLGALGRVALRPKIYPARHNDGFAKPSRDAGQKFDCGTAHTGGESMGYNLLNRHSSLSQLLVENSEPENFSTISLSYD